MEKSDATSAKAEILKENQKKIAAIVKNLKLEYNRKVDEMFGRNEENLVPRVYVDLHSNIKLEVLKLLEMEIKQKIGVN